MSGTCKRYVLATNEQFIRKAAHAKKCTQQIAFVYINLLYVSAFGRMKTKRAKMSKKCENANMQKHSLLPLACGSEIYAWNSHTTTMRSHGAKKKNAALLLSQ